MDLILDLGTALAALRECEAKVGELQAEVDRLRAIELRIQHTPADVIGPEFLHYLLTGEV